MKALCLVLVYTVGALATAAAYVGWHTSRSEPGYLEVRDAPWVGIVGLLWPVVVSMVAIYVALYAIGRAAFALSVPLTRARR